MDRIIKDLEEIVKGEPFKVRPRLSLYIDKLIELRDEHKKKKEEPVKV